MLLSRPQPLSGAVPGSGPDPDITPPPVVMANARRHRLSLPMSLTGPTRTHSTTATSTSTSTGRLGRLSLRPTSVISPVPAPAPVAGPSPGPSYMTASQQARYILALRTPLPGRTEPSSNRAPSKVTGSESTAPPPSSFLSPRNSLIGTMNPTLGGTSSDVGTLSLSTSLSTSHNRPARFSMPPSRVRTSIRNRTSVVPSSRPTSHQFIGRPILTAATPALGINSNIPVRGRGGADDEDGRLFEAAQAEAAELVWKHRNPNTPYPYKPVQPLTVLKPSSVKPAKLMSGVTATPPYKVFPKPTISATSTPPAVLARAAAAPPPPTPASVPISTDIPHLVMSRIRHHPSQSGGRRRSWGVDQLRKLSRSVAGSTVVSATLRPDTAESSNHPVSVRSTKSSGSDSGVASECGTSTRVLSNGSSSSDQQAVMPISPPASPVLAATPTPPVVANRPAIVVPKSTTIAPTKRSVSGAFARGADFLRNLSGTYKKDRPVIGAVPKQQLQPRLAQVPQPKAEVVPHVVAPTPKLVVAPPKQELQQQQQQQQQLETAKKFPLHIRRNPFVRARTVNKSTVVRSSGIGIENSSVVASLPSTSTPAPALVPIPKMAPVSSPVPVLSHVSISAPLEMFPPNSNLGPSEQLSVVSEAISDPIPEIVPAISDVALASVVEPASYVVVEAVLEPVSESVPELILEPTVQVTHVAPISGLALLSEPVPEIVVLPPQPDLSQSPVTTPTPELALAHAVEDIPVQSTVQAIIPAEETSREEATIEVATALSYQSIGLEPATALPQVLEAEPVNAVEVVDCSEPVATITPATATTATATATTATATDPETGTPSTTLTATAALTPVMSPWARLSLRRSETNRSARASLAFINRPGSVLRQTNSPFLRPSESVRTDRTARAIPTITRPVSTVPAALAPAPALSLASAPSSALPSLVPEPLRFSESAKAPIEDGTRDDRDATSSPRGSLSLPTRRSTVIAPAGPREPATFKVVMARGRAGVADLANGNGNGSTNIYGSSDRSSRWPNNGPPQASTSPVRPGTSVGYTTRVPSSTSSFYSSYSSADRPRTSQGPSWNGGHSDNHLGYGHSSAYGTTTTSASASAHTRSRSAFQLAPTTITASPSQVTYTYSPLGGIEGACPATPAYGNGAGGPASTFSPSQPPPSSSSSFSLARAGYRAGFGSMNVPTSRSRTRPSSRLGVASIFP